MSTSNRIRKWLKLLFIVPLLVAFSFTSVAMAQDEPQQTDSEFFMRNFATIEQRQMTRQQRDLAQFDNPAIRDRWCNDNDWIVMGGETLSDIVLNCNIALANILAVNPQISDPDLVFSGEIVRLPTQAQRQVTVGAVGSPLILTEDQQAYMQNLIAAAEGEGIPVTGPVAEDIAGRNMATDAQRRDAAQRDLDRFDETGVREQWCSNNWVVNTGESMGQIAILCGIPLDVLLAHNPQISNPDIVVTGEVINIPDDPFGPVQPALTPAQVEYLEANFGVAPEAPEDEVEEEEEDVEEEEDTEEEEEGTEDEDEDEDEG